MTLARLTTLFAISFPIFACLDILWLGFIMNKVYQSKLSNFLNIAHGKMAINWAPALTVWALIILGAIIFALPRVTSLSISEGLTWGALYGFILYGVYDLTNFSLIAGWPISITLIDIAWGTVANSLLVGFLTWLNNKSFLPL